MTRPIKRPDVAERNRLLKTKQLPVRNCVVCLSVIVPRKYPSKRVLNSKYCSRKCYWATLPTRKGDKSPNWKGGISPLNQSLRATVDYKNWRRGVFKRDGYRCVLCGDKRGGNLVADHIRAFALFPELRTTLSNGRTLCVECHKGTDNYAGKANKKQK